MGASEIFIAVYVAFYLVAFAISLGVYLWMYRRQKRLPDNWRRKEMNENIALLGGLASFLMLIITFGFIHMFWLFILFFPSLLVLLLATGHHWRLAWKLSRALAGTPEAVKAQKADARIMFVPSLGGFVLIVFLAIGALYNGLLGLALLLSAFAAVFAWMTRYYRMRSR